MKGPGEDYDNILLFSEQASFGALNDNVFDFVLRAQISTSATPPQRKPRTRDANEMMLTNNNVKPPQPSHQQQVEQW